MVYHDPILVSLCWFQVLHLITADGEGGFTTITAGEYLKQLHPGFGNIWPDAWDEHWYVLFCKADYSGGDLSSQGLNSVLVFFHCHCKVGR